MNITKIHGLYWSATGHTKKIVTHICHFLSQSLNLPVCETDITSFEARQNDLEIPSTSFVVFGMPTYAGKLPNKIMPYIKEHIHGNQTYVLPIVTFGNRSFDHALAELCFLLSENHFCITGAAALVCEHAFSKKIATGHPNAKDFQQIDDFLNNILDNIQNHRTLSTPIPGDPKAPYYIPKGIDGKPVNFLKAQPMTDMSRCDRCGLCAKYCPMHSINLQDPSQVPGICIKCQRCLQICPKQAKYFDDPSFLSHVQMLETNYTHVKKNQFFF